MKSTNFIYRDVNADNGKYYITDVDYPALMRKHIAKHGTSLQPIFEAVSNSFEASKNEDDKITISLSFSQPGLAGVRTLLSLSIADTGHGIQEEDLCRIQRLFDDSKGYNNFGSGRIQYLHYFDKTDIHTIYEQDGKMYSRRLVMSMKFYKLHHSVLWIGEPKEVDSETKTGTIEIKDSKKPELIVRPVAIIVGESYSAYQFSSSCYDHSGCNIFFEDSSVESKYKNPGTYGPIQISAVDAYNNKTTKEATLTILETPNIYGKFEYSEDGTYSKQTTYTLYFQDLTVNDTVVSNIFCSDTVCSSKEEIYTYTDSNVFEEEKNKHYGEIGYEINEFKQTITHTENITGVGPSQISKKENVINHLESEGFMQK